jgi:hypothetical protein
MAFEMTKRRHDSFPNRRQAKAFDATNAGNGRHVIMKTHHLP